MANIKSSKEWGKLETPSSHLSPHDLKSQQSRMRDSEEAGRFIGSHRLALVRVDSVSPAGSAFLIVYTEVEEGTEH